MAADPGRTSRAALVALLATFAIVTGAGLVLGFEPGTAVAGGAGIGVLAALLIWGAARRADSFHDANEVRPVEPGFPGPPEHADTTDERDQVDEGDG